MKVLMFQVGPRHGKRGRPPKRPAEFKEEEQLVSEPVAEADIVGNTAEDLTTEEAAKKQTPPESAVDGEHTCSECGLSFERRYSLIMHTLKHEKARGYKCSVSVG